MWGSFSRPDTLNYEIPGTWPNFIKRFLLENQPVSRMDDPANM